MRQNLAMARTQDVTDYTSRSDAIAAAVSIARSGGLVVLPTDTVYGVLTDAFVPTGVATLRQAKGMAPGSPVPVLVGSPNALSGLATGLGDDVRCLVEAFWPGPLTVVVRAAPTLTWDLGDNRSTVMVRMPLHPVALEVLRELGPAAVTGANVVGQAAAVTAEEAREQLGDWVQLYLDAGPARHPDPSTVVDCTGPLPRVLRVGALSLELLQQVAPATMAG